MDRHVSKLHMGIAEHDTKAQLLPAQIALVQGNLERVQCLPPDLLLRIELLVTHAYEQVFARCRHPRWH